MSETLLLSIIGGLLAVIEILVAYIFRREVGQLEKRLDRQEERFENYRQEQEKFFYDWRHDEYSRDMSQFEMRIAAVERLPEKVDQLWRRIFNGGSK